MSSKLVSILHISGSDVAVENFNDQFLLLRAVNQTDLNLPVLGREILERRFDFVSEVIAAETEICLKLNDRFDDENLSDLAEVQIAQPSSRQGEGCYQLPVWFSEDGDWGCVCQQTQMNRNDYVQQLAEQRLQVAMSGFLPGFVYLKGLARNLQVPRKVNPDRSTEANAFAIGGLYAGIYSLPSPAGWNVIGRLAVPVMQTDRLPPLVLQPGDLITIRPVERNEYHYLMRDRPTLIEYNG